MLPGVAKRHLDRIEVLPDGLEHNFGRRRVYWLENSIFKAPHLTVDQSRGRGVKSLEQFISASGRAVPKSSRTNADDRLPADPLGRVEGSDGFVEGRDVADVRPQSSVPHPLDDLTQLGTIGLDNEVDRQAVGGPRLGRPNEPPTSSRASFSRSTNSCAPKSSAV
jgi:hypothetical protein